LDAVSTPIAALDLFAKRSRRIAYCFRYREKIRLALDALTTPKSLPVSALFPRKRESPAQLCSTSKFFNGTGRGRLLIQVTDSILPAIILILGPGFFRGVFRLRINKYLEISLV